MQNHAIIVGGGVAGLATAIALRRAGWNATILERDNEPAAGGTALGMWPEAMRALDSLGVGERVRHLGALSSGATILSPSGAPIGRIPSTYGAYLISRENLMLALRGALPTESVHWSHVWRATDQLPESDLVVGADGIHSALRSRVWGTGAERRLNTIAFRGVVDRHANGVTETWGRGALFGITPTGDGRTNWFACVRPSMIDRADADHTETLRKIFCNWHLAIRKVLEQIELPSIDRRDLYDVSLPHSYVRGNTVLVGDAAHAMAPNLGRGACESLIDAVALARALDCGSDLPTGLQRYDRTRRARTRLIVGAARTLNRIATADRGTRLRDRLLSLALLP